MEIEEKEKLYDLILEHRETTRHRLLKATGWDREKLDYYLDILYWEGLIDLRGRGRRKVVPVEKDKINETFLERHIDTPYLFYNVNLEKVESLLRERKGGKD